MTNFVAFDLEIYNTIPEGETDWLDTMTEKYVLNHGSHAGMITSRDIAPPYIFDTRENAIAAYEQLRRHYHSIGYQIWYATITAPDGSHEHLEKNSYKR